MKQNSPLVTIEGIDKAGKGTVISALENEYPDAVFTTEPNDDEWLGEVVREAISGERDVPPMSVFHLFLADHYHHINEVIKPSLTDRDVPLVVCDRYFDSRYAYQQEALQEEFPDNPLNWIRQVQEGPHQTVIPDMTILVDISVDESIRRTADEPVEIFEKRDFLEKVRSNYLQLAEEEEERYVVVDGEQSKDAVKKDCLTHISSLLDDF